MSRLEFTGWRELRARDFILYSNASRESLETFAADIARYVAVVEQVVNHPPPKTPARFFLVSERAEELFAGAPGLGGFIINTLSGFDSLVRGNTHDPIRRFILLHEFTHYLTFRNNSIGYPLWYSEGFADFLGTARMRGDVVEIGAAPFIRLRSLEARRLRRAPIDLGVVFGFEKKGEWRYPPDFYATAWATVHYLNSRREGRSQLTRMVQLQSDGQSWVEAYSRVFDESPETLALEIDAHVDRISRGAPSAIGFIPLDSLDVRLAWTIREVPEAEAARILGELAMRGAVQGARAVSSLRLAEAILTEAIELDAEDPRARAALAKTFANRNAFAEARVHLDAFERAANPDGQSMIYAGNALHAQALSLDAEDEALERTTLLASARALFQRATSMQPDSPQAWASLGRARLEAGELDLARKNLKKAQLLGEWDADLCVDRGRLERQAGFPSRARSYWTEVMRRGSEQQADRAAKLLEELEAQVESDATETSK